MCSRVLLALLLAGCSSHVVVPIPAPVDAGVDCVPVACPTGYVPFDGGPACACPAVAPTVEHHCCQPATP